MCSPHIIAYYIDGCFVWTFSGGYHWSTHRYLYYSSHISLLCSRGSCDGEDEYHSRVAGKGSLDPQSHHAPPNWPPKCRVHSHCLLLYHWANYVIAFSSGFANTTHYLQFAGKIHSSVVAIILSIFSSFAFA